MNSSASYLPALGRLLLGAIFLIAGIGKLFNPAGTIGYISSVGLPLAEFGYVMTLIVEIGGGLLLIAGYRARITALTLAVFTVVAGIFFHNDFADQNQFIHFLKNLALAGGLLQVVAFGAGRFSMDGHKAMAAEALAA
jgi:putative oxidoreductase